MIDHSRTVRGEENIMLVPCLDSDLSNSLIGCEELDCIQ